MRAKILLTLLLLAPAGCNNDPCAGQSGTCIALRVDGTAKGLDQLAVTVDEPLKKTEQTPRAAMILPRTIGLNLPASVSGIVHVTVVGLTAGKSIVTGSGSASVVHNRASIDITLGDGSGTLGDLGADASPPDGAPLDGGPDGGVVAVTPAIVSVSATRFQTFSAGEPVTWSVLEAGGGDIGSDGSYVAAQTPGTYHVVATSSTDATRTGTATVTVTPLTLQLVAGNLAGAGNSDGYGTSARFGTSFFISGNYISDSHNHIIRKIDTFNNYRVMTVAGSGVAGFKDDVGSAAQFSSPGGITTDGTDYYIADTGNGRIRKLTAATNTVSTVASGMMAPTDVVYDQPNARLLVSDKTALRIFAVALPSGSVTPLAGSGVQGSADNATGTMATLQAPTNLGLLNPTTLGFADLPRLRTVDLKVGGTATVTTLNVSPMTRVNAVSAGFISSAWALYSIDATFAVTLVAGSENVPGDVDASGAAARFQSINSLSGTLIADGSALRRNLGGAITTVAGSEPDQVVLDGTGAQASFQLATGLASDGNDTVYVADQKAVRVLTLSTGVVKTLPVTPALDASANGIAYYNGQIYTPDVLANVLLRIDPVSGQSTIVAGTSGSAGSTDGVGAAARFAQPSYLVSDGKGTIYLTDVINNTIRTYDVASGAVGTLAGTGSAGAVDGVGTAASFARPDGLALDGKGALYVADRGNYVVRKIDLATKSVTRLAGIYGQGGATDGPLDSATFEGPWSLACDGSALYVTNLPADSMSAVEPVVRRIDLSSGTVSHFVGVPGQHGTTPGPLPASLGNGSGNGSSNAMPLMFTPKGDLLLANGGAVLIVQP